MLETRPVFDGAALQFDFGLELAFQLDRFRHLSVRSSLSLRVSQSFSAWS